MGLEFDHQICIFRFMGPYIMSAPPDVSLQLLPAVRHLLSRSRYATLFSPGLEENNTHCVSFVLSVKFDFYFKDIAS